MTSSKSKVKPSSARRDDRAGGKNRERPHTEAGKVQHSVDQTQVGQATINTGRLWVGGACLAAGLWVYWPALGELVRAWNTEPDYSHGFLVIPLAVLFLWFRRASFPGLTATSPVLAIVLLATSVALRAFGAKYFMTFMEGWSIVPWVAAVVVAIGGRPLLRWCLPSIGFLIFMVPLPFRIEGELSAPLQRIATKISTTALQLLGQPAFSEGNVILLGEERLEVAQACSGLRLFMSVLALTYAYIAIVVRPWWEKLILALAAIPIAIIANSARIVTTGLIYECTKSEWARSLAHDSAGWAMIVIAAVMFSLLLWYLKVLIYEEEIVDISTLVREARI